MNSFTPVITIITFLGTMIFIFWRPKGLNEAIPATAGALLIFLVGGVSFADLIDISTKVSGAAITILATMVMALSLESFGFFQWVAEKLQEKSNGSGDRLFWYTILLCFTMTIFLNNDGSILITTPILLLLFKNLNLKNHQKIPYLISGALIATASSAPIGVSNIVNLISLEIIGMDLYLYTAMLFIPGIIGLAVLSFLLYFLFRKDFPKNIPNRPYPIIHHVSTRMHPLQDRPSTTSIKKKSKVMGYALLFVAFVRLSLFAASFYEIPISIVAVCGSIILLGFRWYYLKIKPNDIIHKTPWHILIFAFSMYVIIYGLNNIGLTNFLVKQIEPILTESLFHASFTMGLLLSLFSNLFNNHPALMIGTITLTQIDAEQLTLQTIYLANIIGSDIGSLLLPIGTLATLIWMHILKQERVKITWKKYMFVTSIVIPPTVVITLFCLYYWISFVFL